MKQFIISEQIVKGLIDYLVQRPYAEVAPGISALSQLQEYLPENKEPKVEEKIDDSK